MNVNELYRQIKKCYTERKNMKMTRETTQTRMVGIIKFDTVYASA